MEYLRGLRVLRDDPEWISKVLIAGLLAASSMIIPVVGVLVIHGWAAVAMRNAIRGRNAPLPRLEFDLDYLIELLKVGWKGLLASFLWSLPIGIMAAVFAFALIAVVMTMAASGSQDATMIVALAAVGVPLIALMSFVVSILASVAAMRADIRDELSAAFEFREVFSMTRLVLRELVIGTVVLGIVIWLMSVAGMLACFLPIFAVTAVAQLMFASFRAQLYARYLERGGTPLVVAAPKADEVSLGQSAASVF